ncbi:polysaccharide deacetylase family protein [Thermosulfurimonas marina]|uniref:Polysaccharide deacetylase family protein n=1 Tax=Thermosulfurimonas marina TaxID=2047767 RepID=A0A6H1WTT7_9BACT|nr:polysaccharide deacetylase family protein [Thermosulfurimonas marina]QJA06598.1 polysaccharide deacetylase family protein [Thermosulfurimonas marina]
MFRLWRALPPRLRRRLLLGGVGVLWAAGGLVRKIPDGKSRALLVGGSLLFLDTFFPQINLFGQTFWRGKSPSSFALTFDDGPDPRITPRLLDLLGETGFRATFFVLLERAHRWPEILRSLKEEGHEIALHGWSHRKIWTLSPGAFSRELEKACQAFRELLGGPPRWYRPPHGFIRLDQALLLRRFGLRLAGWTVGVWDTDPEVTAEEIYRRVMETLLPGDILLLHDGVADRQRPQKAMLQALASILQELKSRRIRAVTLTDLWEETTKRPCAALA